MISIPRSQRSPVREKQVKQEVGGHFVPVILVTAKSLPRHRRRSRGQKSPCSINASPRQSGKLFKTVMRYLRQLPGIPRIAGESALRCEIEKGSRIIALPGEERTIRGYSGVLHLRGVKSQHPACSRGRDESTRRTLRVKAIQKKRCRCCAVQQCSMCRRGHIKASVTFMDYYGT